MEAVMAGQQVDKKTGEVTGQAGADAGELSPQVVAQFVEMVRLIPTDEGNAMDRIAEQILNSASWEDLDAAWSTDQTDKLVGVEQKIDTLSVQPSTYAGGLPFFLVVHATDLRSGDPVVWSTSSVSMCVQLAKAFHAGWLPLKAKIVQAERASRNGYYPQHLQILDRYAVSV